MIARVASLERGRIPGPKLLWWDPSGYWDLQDDRGRR